MLLLSLGLQRNIQMEIHVYKEGQKKNGFWTKILNGYDFKNKASQSFKTITFYPAFWVYFYMNCFSLI